MIYEGALYWYTHKGATIEQEKECENLIKEALQKQMPKKPTEDTANLTDFKTFYCPICNKEIVSRLNGEWIAGRPQKYCDDCGQALDWSENNAENS